MAVIETLQVHLVKLHPRSQVFEDLGGTVSVGNKTGYQSSRARFFENSHGPFARNQRLVIRADDDPASLADGIVNKVCGRNMHRADNGSGVAQGLRGHPILAVGAVQITAEHSEAVCQCSWVSMEEGFFLYRVALDAADIAPGHIQGSTPVVANFANPRLAVWNFATVPAGKTPHPVAVELFVQFTLANVFMNDFVERTHWCQAQCRGKRQLLAF